MFLTRKVEILEIDPKKKFLSILIHLSCPVSEMCSQNTCSYVDMLVDKAEAYLTAEGFVPEDLTNWKFKVGGVTHVI